MPKLRSISQSLSPLLAPSAPSSLAAPPSLILSAVSQSLRRLPLYPSSLSGFDSAILHHSHFNDFCSQGTRKHSRIGFRIVSSGKLLVIRNSFFLRLFS
ncbi:hypothetical protein QL285_044362 [Trifolium repens]|nr:hypothetical protein QL285_044362 [Trifolium repens]